MVEQIRSFDLSRANCFCEDDRPLVHNNIVGLMLFCGQADENQTDQEVLKTFESLVHTDLSEAVLSSRGKCGLPYMDIVTTIFATDGMFALDIWAASVGVDTCKGKDLRRAFIRFFSLIVTRAFFIPFHFGAVCIIFQCIPTAKGWKLVSSIVGVQVYGMLQLGAFLGAIWALEAKAEEGSDLALVFVALLHAVAALCTAALYCPRRLLKSRSDVLSAPGQNRRISARVAALQQDQGTLATASSDVTTTQVVPLRANALP